MNSTTLVVALLAFVSQIALGQGQHTIQFDRPIYEILPGQSFEAQVMIDPPPAAGLSSYGLRLIFPPANADVPVPSALLTPAALNFNGVLGPMAVKVVNSGVAAAKGTVDFSAMPAVPHRDSLLARFMIEDAGIGPYTLSLSTFNTLGPTEEIFVDGAGNVLDPQIRFASASVVYRQAEAPYTIFAGEANVPNKKKVIYFKGRENTVRGRIHSNSDINVGGKDHVVRDGNVEYVTGFYPTPDFKGRLTIQNGMLVRSTVKPYPVNYVLSDFAPGGRIAAAAQAEGKYFYLKKKDAHLDEFIENEVLREGLYYVEGKVKLGGHKVGLGRVTIVATGEIEIKSKDALFESYTSCLLAFSGVTKDYKKRAIKLSGKNCRWQGIVYAPGGLVEVSSSNKADEWGDSSDDNDGDDPPTEWETENATLLGSLIGRGVRINAKNFQIIGTDPVACPRLISPLKPVIRHHQLQISFLTVLGLSYAVEYSDSLSRPVWNLWTTIEGHGGQVTLKPPLDMATRFYRLRLL